MYETSIRTDVTGASQESLMSILSNQDYIRSRIRYINMNDASSQIRDVWIERCLNKYETLDFGKKADIILSSARSEYDIILMGGEDARRMSDFMKSNIDLISMKPKIAICANSSPARRAKIIMSGFDDVMDTQRTQPVEFIARMFAIWRRYQSQRDLLRQEGDFRRLLNQVAPADILPTKQLLVLTCLLQSPGFCASYNALQLAASSDHIPVSLENLKVIISNLRKFLRSGFSIISDRQSSYRLIMPQLRS